MKMVVNSLQSPPQQQQLESEAERELRLLRMFALVIARGELVNVPASVGLVWVLGGNYWLLIIAVTDLIVGIAALVSLRQSQSLKPSSSSSSNFSTNTTTSRSYPPRGRGRIGNRPNPSPNPRNNNNNLGLSNSNRSITRSKWLLLGSLTVQLVVFQFLLGVEIPTAAAFLIVVALSMFLASQRTTAGLAAIGIVSTIGRYALAGFFHYRPLLGLGLGLEDGAGGGGYWLALVAWVCELAVPTIILAYLARQFKQANAELRAALADVQSQQQTRHLASTHVLHAVSELTSSSHQQAHGSHLQLITASQISSAMTELTTSAHAINEQVSNISEAATSAATSGRQIVETTNHLVRQSQLGVAASDHNQTLSVQVGDFHYQLLQMLEELAKSSQAMRTFNKLIGSITHETHLLSLNAAIEAAGAGEYGERFRVVAGHVRELAGQTKKASEQVASIVSQTLGAIQSAVVTAQAGSEVATALEQVARQTAIRFADMQALVAAVQGQAQAIKGLTDTIHQQSVAISGATYQQLGASEQIAFALQDLTAVAQQHRSNSEITASTSEQLRQLASELVA